LLQAVRDSAGVRESGETTDQELLWQFSQQRDESAFATLMHRHGPLVLGVCRRVLRDPNDADDAFQATFLVLARKAGSVGQPDRLANWLYGVALRVARKARSAVARRHDRQQPVTDIPAAASGRGADWIDLRQVLDDELRCLPEKFRLPILLCYLEGRTREEAARQLGWSAGAVKGMLERGRELLRSRLTRRGVTLSATALAGLLSENALPAAVPAVLRDSTLEAALLFAAGKATPAEAASRLAEGVLQTMWISRVKLVAAWLLAVAIASTAAGMLAFGGGPAGPEAPKKAGPVPGADGEADLLRKKAAARVDLARGAYAGYFLLFQLGMEHEQTVTLWSRRWLQAQLDLSDKQADRDAALQAHRDRLAKVDEIACARLDLGGSLPPGVRVVENDPKSERFAQLKNPTTVGKENYEAAWKEFQDKFRGRPETVCNASVLYLMAQQDERRRHKTIPQADAKDLQAHLDRVRKVEAILEVRHEAGANSDLDLDTIRFHRLQAEEWLAQGKTFPPKVLDPGSEPEK
jgi:RNA polymerase sigma factor (sigma-70 family)